jgi:hypothetical protein
MPTLFSHACSIIWPCLSTLSSHIFLFCLAVCTHLSGHARPLRSTTLVHFVQPHSPILAGCFISIHEW